MLGLQCFILLIRIRIVAIFALIPIHLTRSQVKSLKFSGSPSSLADSGAGITLAKYPHLHPHDPHSPLSSRNAVHHFYNS
jgi:hypothetical protein